MKNKWILLAATILIFSCSRESSIESPNNAQKEHLTRTVNNEMVFETANGQQLLGRSCSDFRNDGSENSKGVKSCSFINSNRISGQNIATHGIYSAPNNYFVLSGAPYYESFLFKLKNATETEIRIQYGLAEDVYITNIQPVVSSDLNFYFNEHINTTNLVPNITSSSANVIYREVTCPIIDLINTYPSLPSNQFYFVELTYIQVDYSMCAGSEETFINVFYTINKGTH